MVHGACAELVLSRRFCNCRRSRFVLGRGQDPLPQCKAVGVTELECECLLHCCVSSIVCPAEEVSSGQGCGGRRRTRAVALWPVRGGAAPPGVDPRRGADLRGRSELRRARGRGPEPSADGVQLRPAFPGGTIRQLVSRAGKPRGPRGVRRARRENPLPLSNYGSRSPGQPAWRPASPDAATPSDERSTGSWWPRRPASRDGREGCSGKVWFPATRGTGPWRCG
jgi:hypothetical protein